MWIICQRKKHTSQNGNFDMAKSTVVGSSSSFESFKGGSWGRDSLEVSHSPNLSQHMEENPHETWDLGWKSSGDEVRHEKRIFSGLSRVLCGDCCRIFRPQSFFGTVTLECNLAWLQQGFTSCNIKETAGHGWCTYCYSRELLKQVGSHGSRSGSRSTLPVRPGTNSIWLPYMRCIWVLNFREHSPELWLCRIDRTSCSLCIPEMAAVGETPAMRLWGHQVIPVV